MDALTCAIIGHLVGDYLLQNDFLANGKKKASWICSIHAAIWTVCVMLFAGWRPDLIGVPKFFIAYVVLFNLHYIQDRGSFVVWWMKRMGQSKFMQCDQVHKEGLIDVSGPAGNIQWRYVVTPGLGPWSIIVVDNVWHIVQIWAVWKFIVCK